MSATGLTLDHRCVDAMHVWVTRLNSIKKMPSEPKGDNIRQGRGEVCST